MRIRLGEVGTIEKHSPDASAHTRCRACLAAAGKGFRLLSGFRLLHVSFRVESSQQGELTIPGLDAPATLSSRIPKLCLIQPQNVNIVLSENFTDFLASVVNRHYESLVIASHAGGRISLSISPRSFQFGITTPLNAFTLKAKLAPGSKRCVKVIPNALVPSGTDGAVAQIDSRRKLIDWQTRPKE